MELGCCAQTSDKSAEIQTEDAAGPDSMAEAAEIFPVVSERSTVGHAGKVDCQGQKRSQIKARES